MTSNSSDKPGDAGTDSHSRAAQASPRGVYNPVVLRDRDEETGGEPPLIRLLAGLLFTVIFAVAYRRPEFGPLTILVLTGCLLYRLDELQRKLAAAPLILAAIRLSLMHSAQLTGGGGFVLGSPMISMPTGDWGIPWIPAFLSVCLFYLPRKDSTTLKIVAFEAMAVILSSLLPDGGFVSVLTIFHYTLFFAIAIGLLFDLKPGTKDLFRAPQAVPIRVHFPATPPPPRPAV